MLCEYNDNKKYNFCKCIWQISLIMIFCFQMTCFYISHISDSNVHLDSIKRDTPNGKMTAAENVCYTLINVPNDSEPPSEVSLKADLGKCPFWNTLASGQKKLTLFQALCTT